MGCPFSLGLKPIVRILQIKINSKIVQGGRNGSGARRSIGSQGATVHSTVPDESRADVAVHGFYKWDTSALFDMQNFNLDVGSYLHQTSVKALTMEEKEKNDKYLQPYLERRRNFNPMVCFMDIISGTEAEAAQKCLALLISNKLKLLYS